MNSKSDMIASRPERIPVDIPVTISSVLTSGEATLRNLTEYGAMIEGLALPKGTQFQIEYEEQTVYGFVVWTEPDRFGARFPFPLFEGPLHNRLEHARMRHEMHRQGVPATHMATTPGVFRPLPQFGRRRIG